MNGLLESAGRRALGKSEGGELWANKTRGNKQDFETRETVRIVNGGRAV